MQEEDKVNLWRLNGRVITAIGIAIIILGVMLYVYVRREDPLPTCSDAIQNQNEVGIDCGGACQVSCSNTYRPISVKYARALKVKDDTYDLVAMIENTNLGSYPKEVEYTMTAYNTNGEKSAEVKGKTFLNTASQVPVILQNVNSAVPINKVFLNIDTAVMYDKADSKSSKVKLVSSAYNDDTKVMTIKVKNTGDISIRNVSIRGVITDSLDSAVAAGQRQISQMSAGEEKEVTITWYESLGLPSLRSQVYIVADPYYNN